MKKLPKIILTDIDGVWTDAGMYYDQKGNELKKFNTSDSAGVLFSRMLNIPVGIITGENTEIVKNRAKKLKIEILYQGISDKVSVAKKICEAKNITLKDVAYIGDDIGDYRLLKLVGYSCAPSNASKYIKDVVNYVTLKKGGDGAFREFVEHIIGQQKIKKMLENL